MDKVSVDKDCYVRYNFVMIPHHQFQSAWFDALSPNLRAAILAHGRRRRFDQGQWIYGEGDEQSGVAAVLEGVVRLEVAVDADRSVLIGLVPQGAFLGQSRSVGGGQRIVTARAGRPSQILLLDDQVIGRIAATQPEIFGAINQLLYGQLDMVVRSMAQLLVLSPKARVAARLLSSAMDGRVMVNQSDLAEMTGMSRKTVNGHLGEMARAGAIQLCYGEIQLLDSLILEQIASQV